MTIPEIIAQLTHSNGAFPRDAVTEAIAQREAVTPELLRILEEATSNIGRIARQDDYMGHIYALYLLAQFREESAYQPIVNLACADWAHVDMALGDIVTEDLGRMLASVCNGDTSLICGMVENADINEYVRSAALSALVTLVAQGVKTREEVMAYFLGLFEGKLERKPDHIWGSLVCECCNIYPLEAAGEIERAFDDGLVDTGHVGRDDVERDLARGRGHAHDRLAKDSHYMFIDDTVHEMARWPCFQTSPQPAKTKALAPSWKPAPARTGQKVGRNEPCPCGSGKKYKKCCGGV